jgi:multidrug efflux pump subunit AcrA (membrane-fusion protein)
MIYLRWIGYMTVTSIILVAGLVAIFAPAYISPNSRLWAGAYGYPALLRALERPIPVDVIEAERRSLSSSVSADGRMVFEQEVPVSVEVVGVVENIGVQVGDIVSQGDVLLKFESGGIQTDLVRSELDFRMSELESAKLRYERSRDSLQKGLIPIDRYEAHERALRQAEYGVVRAQETLVQTLTTRSQLSWSMFHDEISQGDGSEEGPKVLAPTSGTIIGVELAERETLVSPRYKALTIGSNLMFRAYVDQRHFGQVRVADNASIYLLSRPNSVIAGKVARIEPLVTTRQDERKLGVPASTFAVWIALPNEEKASGHIARGMNGYVTFTYSDEALVVPARALLRYSGGNGSLLVVTSDNRVETRPVQYQRTDGMDVEITGGLKAGEQVVVSGQIGLVEGDLITIR